MNTDQTPIGHKLNRRCGPEPPSTARAQHPWMQVSVPGIPANLPESDSSTSALKGYPRPVGITTSHIRLVAAFINILELKARDFERISPMAGRAYDSQPHAA